MSNFLGVPGVLGERAHRRQLIGKIDPKIPAASFRKGGEKPSSVTPPL